MGELASLSDLAHLHLLLNHIPTVGFVVAIGLLLLSFIRDNEHLKRVSLEVIFLVALFTLPAYMSGVAAQAALEGQSGVSQDALTAHQDGALLAFLLMQATGFAAWVALWQLRRLSKPASWSVGATTVLALLTLAVVAPAASIGGEIRHPEIVAPGAVPPVPGWLSVASIADFFTNSQWAWPTCETLHFLGMSLIFGVLLVVNLRLLGFMKGVSYAALHRLLPWAMLGFAVNVATGMLFFIAAPDQYVENPTFHWKVILLVFAGANLLYLTVADRIYATGPDDGAQALGKLVALSSLASWVGVAYFGRMLPFLGSAF